MATKTQRVYKVGDTVKVFAKKYIRGTRGPGFAGRFTRKALGFGILLSKFDPAAHAGTATGDWTEEQLRVHFGSHIGLINATMANDNGLTERNNPVRMPDGRVIWLDRDSIS